MGGPRAPAPSWQALRGARPAPPAPAIDPLEASYRQALELHRAGRLGEAERAYRQLLAIAPRHVPAAQGLGLVLYQSGYAGKAEPLLRAVVAARPDDPLAAAHLGMALLAMDRADEALAVLHPAARRAPRSAPVETQLAAALLVLGRAHEAAQAAKRAVKAAADDAAAHAQLGRALLSLGETGEAITHLRRATSLQPAFADAHAWLGDALAAVSPDAAAASYQAAIRLLPTHVEAHLGLARLLAARGQWAAAANGYRAAIYTQPSGAAFAGLGTALLALADSDAATAAFETAARLAPDDEAVAAARAAAREQLGLPLLPPSGPLSALEREEIRYRMAVAVTPGNPVALGNLGGALLKLGRLKEACHCFREALALKPDYFHVWSELLFAINYLGEMPVADMVAEARRYGEAVATAVPARAGHANDRDPARRLRVGLVSADLRAHPVARFLEAPLAALDPAEMELIAYDVGGRPDAVTQRLRPLVSRWHEAAAWSDRQLEAAIRADAIDILVDLSGHTVGNRLLVFAQKPAPVAVTWLGYFATTGLRTIDYVLASPWAIPAGEETQWVETPWQLPETYLCFTPPKAVVPLAPPAAQANGFVTFGSANALNKLSDATLACWAQVLAAVPGSHLLLRSPPLGDARVAAGMRERFVALGVAGDRLMLDAGTSDYAAHLGRYNAVDIALDPFPYAGGTTTAEALWMGVPVLTLKGDRYVAHMGENILQNMGLGDWVASDTADYVAKAMAFAADVPRLAALRQELRHRLTASPVGDAPRFARALETAFRGMWRKWCAEQAD